ncbi:MAG TPA: hypothetical protein VKC53_00565 [Patescibacteria group bacterium]|nr:hypothetical protein [Patescibacteria group bacterium]
MGKENPKGLFRKLLAASNSEKAKSEALALDELKKEISKINASYQSLTIE